MKAHSGTSIKRTRYGDDDDGENNGAVGAAAAAAGGRPQKQLKARVARDKSGGDDNGQGDRQTPLYILYVRVVRSPVCRVSAREREVTSLL